MKEVLMHLGTKEHEDIIAAFERAFPYGRKDKEPKEHWKNGNVYQDGQYNQLFLAFRHGIAYAQCIERLNQS